MFNYHLGLALASLKRNVALTILMIATIGVGVGATITTLTVFRAMSQDPIPRKSAQLFTPQIDNWGPDASNPDKPGWIPDQLAYSDAMALIDAHAAKRQTAMYVTQLALIPDNSQLQPFQVDVRAVYSDFFPMFEVPFLYGSPWSRLDDENRAAEIVITRRLNDKLFAGTNSVGRTVNLDNREYRVVGVLNDWQPIPRFYDVTDEKFSKTEDIFLPLTHAIETHMETSGNFNCAANVGSIDSGWEGRLHSECVWLQFWVELPTVPDSVRYRSFLANYAAEQRRTGRFNWPARTELRNVQQWLVYKEVVPDSFRMLLLVSFSFLFVCLLNAMGLLLAKIMGRASDIGIRRALGADRGAILAQYMIESAVIGFAGALLGLVFTAVALLGLRNLLSESIGLLTDLNLTAVATAVVLSVICSLFAGLYPSWRATRIQPAWHLKTQ